MTKFTDTHCHLDFPELSESLTTLLSQCVQQNIQQIIVPSVCAKNWQQVLNLANTYPHATNISPKVVTALGIHPWYIHESTTSDLDALESIVQTALLTKPQQIVAVGETGLDLPMADKHDNLSTQKAFFQAQVNIAKQHSLPLIVHHRRSHNETIEILKAENFTSGGILHAFSGSYQQAMQYVDMGFKLGIGGTITYPRAKKTINAIKRLPLSSLVLETDAPSMPLNGYQGEINSPLKLIQVFQVLVEIRSESETELARQLEQNVQAMFSL